MAGRRGEVGGGREVVGRRGKNFGVEKRWKKKKKSEQGGPRSFQDLVLFLSPQIDGQTDTMLLLYIVCNSLPL
jgi:hypothetical protein